MSNSEERPWCQTLLRQTHEWWWTTLWLWLYLWWFQAGWANTCESIQEGFLEVALTQGKRLRFASQGSSSLFGTEPSCSQSPRWICKNSFCLWFMVPVLPGDTVLHRKHPALGRSMGAISLDQVRGCWRSEGSASLSTCVLWSSDLPASRSSLGWWPEDEGSGSVFVETCLGLCNHSLGTAWPPWGSPGPEASIGEDALLWPHQGELVSPARGGCLPWGDELGFLLTRGLQLLLLP